MSIDTCKLQVTIDILKRLSCKAITHHVNDCDYTLSKTARTWNELFIGVADTHVPIKKDRLSGLCIPWMTNTISEAMRNCVYHRRKAVKSCSPFHAARERRSATSLIVK